MSLNCRAHTKSPEFERQKEQWRGDVALEEVEPERRDLHADVLDLLFWHKTHVEHVLSGCTNAHGDLITHCLRIESFSIEVGKGGINSPEALCVFFSMVACSPRTIGLGSISPWIWRDALQDN